MITRDLLAAGRVANLPTVWTNVYCGAALTAASVGVSVWSLNLLVATLAGSLLYLAGCLYNDYYDRDWDAQHKPERAIPAGRLAPRLLLKLIIILAALGLALSSTLGATGILVASAICVFVYLYTIIHKRTALGIIPMGICRACLYLLGAATIGAFKIESLMALPVLIPALGLMAYIAGITLIARSEAQLNLPSWAKWIGLVLLVTPSLTHLQTQQFDLMVFPLLFFWIYLSTAWDKLQQNIGAFVSKCLVGICIVDAIALLTIEGDLTMRATSFAIIALCAISAHLLQQKAPAT